MTSIMESKGKLQTKEMSVLKKLVEKDCWVSLKRYFDGAGNGPEAKVAVVTLGTLARERQADNNARQLNIIEKRLWR